MNGARGRSGFEPFVAARRTGLLRSAFLLTRQREEAEDLVQHALMKLYVAWPGVESNPDAYLRRVIVNAYIDAGRRRRRLPPVVDAPTTVEPGDAVGERDEMWRALGELPAQQRAVLILRYYEDLSEAETAAVLGCSIGTVKSHSSRALAHLRASVDRCRR